jgi:hypothetical protein
MILEISGWKAAEFHRRRAEKGAVVAESVVGEMAQGLFL